MPTTRTGKIPLVHLSRDLVDASQDEVRIWTISRGFWTRKPRLGCTYAASLIFDKIAACPYTILIVEVLAHSDSKL